MEVIWNIFLTVALVTPILIFLLGITNLICKEIFIAVAVKTVFSLIIHFVATAIVFLILIIFFSGGGDRAPSMTGQPPSFSWFEAKLLLSGSLVVFCYACFDLFLCWFAATELEQSLKMIERKHEKLLTLLD